MTLNEVIEKKMCIRDSLYMEQKVQSKETFSDNAMDTQQYWSEVTMAGKVDESIPYCERFKSYTNAK